MTFAPGQLRACYNQSVVDDEEPESPESFILRIVDNPDITPGVPPTTQINIIDDDGREFLGGSLWLAYVKYLHSEQVTCKQCDIGLILKYLAS